MQSKGVYIHIPFCASKCPYCDFYSSVGTAKAYDSYTGAVIRSLEKWGQKLSFHADTLYFGGGTPALIGAERLVRIADAVKSQFGGSFEEVTVEMNPSGKWTDFSLLRKNGFNRLSVGLQSALDNELAFLGRKHTAKQAADCIKAARSAGFDNISLDLMIALQGQTRESLKKSVEFCVRQDVQHISAYILKIEPGTVFYKRQEQLVLPDEDETADLYEYLCCLMREYGYLHYEISNFCRPGYEGRHNLRYWHDEEYLGIGPSAHSFIDGQRFYYPRKMQDFLDDRLQPDGSGGDMEEFIMLGLRLAEGITQERFRQRFGKEIPEKYLIRGERLSGSGLIQCSDAGFALTEKGFLVSNAVINAVLD